MSNTIILLNYTTVRKYNGSKNWVFLTTDIKAHTRLGCSVASDIKKP